MTASIGMDVLAAAVLVIALVSAGVAFGAFLIYRAGRRRWRLLRTHGAVMAARAAWGTLDARFRPPEGVPTASTLTSWPATRVRGELRNGVARANEALAVAEGAGAPTADLGILCRRLAVTASSLERVVTAHGSGPVPAALADQVVELLRAADDVRRAALASAGDASQFRTRQLAVDARHEIDLLDEGLRSARTSVPGLSR